MLVNSNSSENAVFMYNGTTRSSKIRRGFPLTSKTQVINTGKSTIVYPRTLNFHTLTMTMGVRKQTFLCSLVPAAINLHPN